MSQRFGCIVALLASAVLNAQQAQEVLGFREFMAQVKQFHPLARQAQLVLDQGEAELLQARGGFDPKLEVDLERKAFKGSTYYDRLNATFTIPTWYGIALKGGYSQSDGDFLDPSEVLPSDGLYSAGVSVNVGRGLWMDQRMATLRKARFFRSQSQAQQVLELNALLANAAEAYFDWLQAYQDTEVYLEANRNAADRLEAIRLSARAGDLPAIDTVEAGIAVANRQLGWEQSRVRLRQASLEVSGFLWLADDIPVELRESVQPESDPSAAADWVLGIEGLTPDSLDLGSHPKIQTLDYKIRALEVDRQLKANQLLPEIGLEYNFLTETPDRLNGYDPGQYKGGLSVYFPLFLRKERGALKLAKIKVQDTELEQMTTTVSIRNKVLGIFSELESYGVQRQLIRSIVGDYQRLMDAEERKFSFGESSLFILNSRERILIDSQLKANEVGNKFFRAKVKLFRAMALDPNNLAGYLN